MSKIAKKRKRLNIISNVYAFLVYALLYIPVAVMMVFSFNDRSITITGMVLPHSGTPSSLPILHWWTV